MLKPLIEDLWWRKIRNIFGRVSQNHVAAWASLSLLARKPYTHLLAHPLIEALLHTRKPMPILAVAKILSEFIVPNVLQILCSQNWTDLAEAQRLERRSANLKDTGLNPAGFWAFFSFFFLSSSLSYLDRVSFIRSLKKVHLYSLC